MVAAAFVFQKRNGGKHTSGRIGSRRALKMEEENCNA